MGSIPTKERMKMIQTDRKKNIVAMLLVLVFVMLTIAAEGLAQQRYRHHHSKTKGAIVGGVVGAVGGGLIGGKKGAVIGAGAGAGTGYLIQRHRNQRHRRVIRLSVSRIAKNGRWAFRLADSFPGRSVES